MNPASERDWTEDAGHENGCYQCLCVNCGQSFIGHKRRHVCRVCGIKPEPVCRQCGGDANAHRAPDGGGCPGDFEPVAAPSALPEAAWLIERRGSPHAWLGATVGCHGKPTWMTANYAFRFSRKEDAERVATALGLTPDAFVVTEHCWPEPAAAPKPEPATKGHDHDQVQEVRKEADLLPPDVPGESLPGGVRDIPLQRGTVAVDAAESHERMEEGAGASPVHARKSERIAAAPKPEPVTETMREAAKGCTGEMFGEQAAVKPVAAPSASAEERIAALRDRDEALREFAESFTIDGDQIVCVKCKRRCIASREGEPFVHASGCPKHRVGGMPWTVLANILLSPVGLTSIAARAAEAERLRKENADLRSALIDCGRQIGCVLADDVSTEFIAGTPGVPSELRAFLSDLRAKLHQRTEAFSVVEAKNAATIADLRAKLEAAEKAVAEIAAIRMLCEAKGGESTENSVRRVCQWYLDLIRDDRKKLAAAEAERDDLALQVAANELEPAAQDPDEALHLFHVQDGDRPMYVVARDWSAALDAWWRVIRAENEGVEDLGEPDGISMVARADDLLIDGRALGEVR